MNLVKPAGAFLPRPLISALLTRPVPSPRNDGETRALHRWVASWIVPAQSAAIRAGRDKPGARRRLARRCTIVGRCAHCRHPGCVYARLYYLIYLTWPTEDDAKPAVRIRQAGVADALAVTALLLSEPASQPAHAPDEAIREMLAGERGIVLLAEVAGRAVGVATGEVATSLRGMLPARLRVRLPARGSVGVLRSLAVTATARGQGVGSDLSMEMVRRLWAAGARRVVSLAAVGPDGSIPARTPLEAAGLRQVGTVAGGLPGKQGNLGPGPVAGAVFYARTGAALLGLPPRSGR